jgi:metal-responsive CopG/Arc/MetJ family transcriptional regulator
MISLPDDLLDRLDAHARRNGTTRSGLVRELAERELATNARARRGSMRKLLTTAAGHGGESARYVREQRLAR